MTAQITAFISRSRAGLVNPKSVSRNITPQNGGVTIHYGGLAQAAANPDSDHALCYRAWRGWQNYHMKTRGFVDVAYTGAFCNHGYAFAGRGAGVRTGANGTSDGNQNYYAIVWIGGEGQKPTQAALDAADWWIRALRRIGQAGDRVVPHLFHKSTACPGTPLKSYSWSRDGQVIEDNGSPPPREEEEPAPAPREEPTPSPVSAQVADIQRALEVTPDGKWGPKTDARALEMRKAAQAKTGYPVNIYRSFDIREVQGVIDTKVDGIWGPNSQRSMREWVKEFQTALRVGADGKYGPISDGKFLTLRRRYLNNY